MRSEQPYYVERLERTRRLYAAKFHCDPPVDIWADDSHWPIGVGDTLKGHRGDTGKRARVGVEGEEKDNTGKRARVEGHYTINVRMLTGETIVTVVRNEDTVIDLKKCLHTTRGFPLDQQRIIFNGRQLRDESILKSHAMGHNDLVYMILRLAAC